MKKNILSFAMIMSAALLVSCGNGDDDDTTTTDTTTTMTTDTTITTTPTVALPPLNSKDSQFVMEAASGGMLEVEAGRLAEQNATNERVKAFGAMMVRDHSNANNELRAMVTGRNLMLPDSMMSKHKKNLESLRSKTGKAFDRQYMSMMVTDHNEDINKFQVASNNAQDTAIKGFATRTLPILRMHKDSATAISKLKL
jgi:putative membrane protein